VVIETDCIELLYDRGNDGLV